MRFRRDRRGVVAVEFAILAIPFLLLLIGTLELAVAYFTETLLQAALAEQVREVRTGAVQTSNPPITADDFRQRVCDGMREAVTTIDCDRLHIDMRSFPSFSASSIPNPPLDGAGRFDETQLVFDPGGAERTIVAQGFYRYVIVTPLMRPLLQDLPDGERLLRTAELFRTEPFQ